MASVKPRRRHGYRARRGRGAAVVSTAARGGGAGGEDNLSEDVARILTRRRVLLSSAGAAAGWSALAGSLGTPFHDYAFASEPTLAEVTPVVTAASPLTALESGTVSLFQRSTRSVVNVVDLTVLSGQAMKSGSVVPEGNGTGVVWDSEAGPPHCLLILYPYTLAASSSLAWPLGT